VSDTLTTCRLLELGSKNKTANLLIFIDLQDVLNFWHASCIYHGQSEQVVSPHPPNLPNTMKLKHLFLGILIPAALSISASALSITSGPITVYDTLNGGSGDTDNVLYNPGQTGTTVNATLNTSGGAFAGIFTSTNTLTTGGGQASLSNQGGGTFSNLAFSLLGGNTFTKLILNPDAIGNGQITFEITYIMPAGVSNIGSFTLNGNGQNYFTVESASGASMSEVRWTSTVGVVDANQYRVGGIIPYTPPSRVPDGGTTVATLGFALLGLGSMRKLIGLKA
jgi:hypothetical protein